MNVRCAAICFIFIAVQNAFSDRPAHGEHGAGDGKAGHSRAVSSNVHENGVPTAATAVPAPVVWTTDLSKMRAPDRPVSGQLLGRRFTPTKTEFRAGTLSFASNDFTVFITLERTQRRNQTPADVLVGKTVRINTRRKNPPRISISHLEDERKQWESTSFANGYSMVLKFGPVTDEKIPARIYLCLPDKARSTIAGTFALVPAETVLRNERLHAKKSTQPAPVGTTAAPPTGGHTALGGGPIWTMSLSEMEKSLAKMQPGTPVTGRVDGKEFQADTVTIVEGAVFAVTEATLCLGSPPTKPSGHSDNPSIWIRLGSGDFKTSIKTAKEAAGRTFRVQANQRSRNFHVRVAHYKDPSWEQDHFDDQYAMVLRFGNLKDGVIPGKIYLCLPDRAKSVVAGTFQIDQFEGR